MRSVLLSNYWHCLKNTFSFKGRVCRSEYWAFSIIHSFMALVLSVAGPFFLGSFNMYIFGVFTFAFFLFCLIPLISINIKRLHDFNASGFYMFMCFLPFAQWFLSIACSFLRGNLYTNKYGKSTCIYGIEVLDYIIICLYIGAFIIMGYNITPS